jgi:hypothetical protein
VNYLSAVGVEEAKTKVGDEVRKELRMAATNDLVAWFRVARRDSSSDTVIGISVQVVDRHYLTPAQRDAVRSWLEHETKTALPG